MHMSRHTSCAELAKEHDILWGGGMPDDITVITLLVTDLAAEPT